MKLGEIKGIQSFDVLANLTQPVIRIAKDKEAIELFDKKKVPKGKDPKVFMLERFESGLPALIETHALDFAEIMAILNNQTVDEYVEGLTPISLFKDIMELITDDEFLAFLS